MLRRYGRFGQPTLSQGDTGTAVQIAQQDLIDLGYSVGSTGADGNFGPNTESAVMQFQAAGGIAQTGQIDEDTWNLFLSMGENVPDTNSPLPSSSSSSSSGTPTSLQAVPLTSATPAAPTSSSGFLATLAANWKLYTAIGIVSVGGIALLWGFLRRKNS